MNPEAPVPYPIPGPGASNSLATKLVRPHWMRRSPGRLLLAVILGTMACLIAPVKASWHIRAVIGWDVGALTLSLLAWRIILRSGPKATAAHAAPEDPGGTAVWVLALISSIFSLF